MKTEKSQNFMVSCYKYLHDFKILLFFCLHLNFLSRAKVKFYSSYLKSLSVDGCMHYIFDLAHHSWHVFM